MYSVKQIVKIQTTNTKNDGISSNIVSHDGLLVCGLKLQDSCVFHGSISFLVTLCHMYVCYAFIVSFIPSIDSISKWPRKRIVPGLNL